MMMMMLIMQIHPIFVLSVADFILACLWIIGGSFWLRRPIEHNIGCLVVSLLTVVSVRQN